MTTTPTIGDQVNDTVERIGAKYRSIWVNLMGRPLEDDILTILRRKVIESLGGMLAFLDKWSRCPNREVKRHIVALALPLDCEEVIELVLADLDELHGGGRAERAYKANGKRW